MLITVTVVGTVCALPHFFPSCHRRSQHTSTAPHQRRSLLWRKTRCGQSQHTALLALQTVCVLPPMQGVQHAGALVCTQCKATTLYNDYFKWKPDTCATIQGRQKAPEKPYKCSWTKLWNKYTILHTQYTQPGPGHHLGLFNLQLRLKSLMAPALAGGSRT
jgi:hypothetical protein